MARSLKLVIIIVLLIMGLIGWSLHALSQSDELGSKAEWSELQAIVVENGKTKLRENVVFEDQSYRNKYLILGIAGKGDKPDIWILLNSAREPFYKQLPKGDFAIDQDTLNKALATGKVNPIVAKELSKRLISIK